MQRFKILHRTYYNFSAPVQLGPHALRLRPREGHELRIESSILEIDPPATLRWQRDVEDNSVAIATFAAPARKLSIESQVVIQQYNQNPLDFLLADYATDYPFAYPPEDWVILSSYAHPVGNPAQGALAEWVAKLWSPGEADSDLRPAAAPQHPHSPDPELSAPGGTRGSDRGADALLHDRFVP